ncbi:unnamed protein product [Clonostachys rhizophaga]|uniref:ABC transmembrane type-1 domain-containing protein n=1 Tax=Clonostachys rhizophaga TaxID=160324 RepID=A0A9N9YJP8_9HYPO|nr:unnamed protein product [Clonostachys rhizophaga]
MASWQTHTCPSDNTFGPIVHGCRDDFDFTLLFEHLFFTIVPCAVFIFASSYKIRQLCRVEQIANGKLLQGIKSVVHLAHSILRLAILYNFSKTTVIGYTSARLHHLGITATAFAFLGALTALILSWLAHSRCPRPSFTLTIFLFLTFLLDLAQSRTLLTISPSSWGIGYIFSIATGVKALALLLESYPKTWASGLKQPSPEPTLGIFSLMTYYWLSPLIRLGSRKLLGITDLYNLDPPMTFKQLDPKFWVSWNTSSNWKGKTRLLVALWRATKWELLAPVIPRLAKLEFGLCQPFLIQAVGHFLSEPKTSEWAREGRALVGATGVIYLGSAASLGLYQYYNQRASSFLRGLLVVGIYRKTTELRLSSDDSKASLTLVSADVERIQQCAHGFHDIWASIIEFFIVACLLYLQLGLAFLVPIGVASICFLITVGIGKTAPRLQRAWVDATEKRIGITATLIENMKAIKIMGVNKQLGDFVQAMRDAEINAGSSFRMTIIYSVTCSYAPMILSPLLTFAATSRDFDTTRAFTSLAFIRLLTIPLGKLFQLLPALVSATACFDRVASYLEAESRSDYRLRSFVSSELPNGSNSGRPRDNDARNNEHATASLNATPAFSIKDGYFGWRDNNFVLRQINLSIPQLKLTMVVGPVASGKLSKIGFCDQSPYIPDARLRDVIVGHGDYDEVWYKDVLEATALSQDIATFAQRDQSTTGSNGCNPESCYRACTLCKTIGVRSEGLIRRLRATAVLCSHSTKHLAWADLIIALGADGMVKDQGTYQELKENQEYTHSLDINETENARDEPGGPDSQESDDLYVAQPDSTPEFEIDDRQRQIGDFAVYKRYLSTLGPVLLCLFFLLTLAYNWPWYGEIKMKDVSASYEYMKLARNTFSDQPYPSITGNQALAVKELNFTIKAGEKIAVVGRTGSGKSSIVLILLHLLDPLPSDNQTITIDGVPLSKVDRTSWNVNLDPYAVASLDECESALKQVGLWTLILGHGGLEEPMKADFLSQGQKQLFDVHDTGATRLGGVVLLDEVAASVDSATDSLIHEILHREFEGYTVLAVTHKEHALQDFNRVMVLENGVIKEFRNVAKS